MNGFYKFMKDRYGADGLSWGLLGLSVILIAIVWLLDIWFLCLLPIIPAAFAIFRTFSRNIPARRRERAFFAGLGDNLALTKNKFRDRKTHIYFKCARCGTVLRIPRNIGVKKVTCPRCKSVSEKDTGSAAN